MLTTIKKIKQIWEVPMQSGKRKFTLLIATLFFSFQTFSQAPNWLWAKGMGGTGDDTGWSIAVDASCNVYTTGYFVGTVDFDPGAGVFNLTSANNVWDIFICKLDASGNFIWAKAIGANGTDVGRSIAIDASGNVYTTGYFQLTVDFDPGAGVFNLTSAAGHDIFILKLDSSGNFVWAKRMGGTGNDWGYSAAIDASGNVYTAGSYSGTADFDPGIGIFNLTSVGGGDLFISKLDNSGNFLWAKAMGGLNYDYCYSIALGSAGNRDVYTTGSFQGTVDFDPGAGVFNLTSAGSGDIFISKLDSSGNFIWAKAMGGTSGPNNIGQSIAIDPAGNGDVYTTGNFGGTVDFDPGTGVFNLTSTGLNDIFISKLDSSGNFIWAKAMGGTSQDFGESIVLDSEGSGHIYTTGYFNGTVDFDPGTGVFNLTSAGLYDVFISQLDSSGNFVWAKSIGGTNYEIGHALALDTSGHLHVAGGFMSTSIIFSTTTLINAGASTSDIFNAKLDTTSSGCTGVSITNTLSNQNASVGGTATWSVNVSGTAPFTYQWYLNSTLIPTATNDSFTTPLLALGDSGNTYYCIVTNCSGSNSDTSNTATLAVTTGCAGVSITNTLSNQNATVGGTATWSVNVSGTPPFTYQWYLNSALIPSATNDSFTTPTLALPDNGNTYYCVVTNCSGSNSDTSNTATLTVTAASVPSWIGIYANDLNHFINPAWQLLDSTSITQAFPNAVKICADGSNVTVIKYLNNNSSIPTTSITFNMQSDPNELDTNQYGRFFPTYTYSGDTVIARFRHPKYVIPNWFNLFRTDNIEVYHGTNLLYSYPIKIYRAPVVFVHGLWGTASTFEQMQNEFMNNGLYPVYSVNPNIYESPLLYRVDYAYYNGASYFTNRGQVKFGILQVIRQARTEKYSAGKAIVIGHSMGGVLSRLYLQGTDSWPDIAYRNDMIKLITLNTPHYGAQTANWLWNPFNPIIDAISTLQSFMSPYVFFNNGDTTAIRDLQVNSPETLNRLNIAQSLQNKVASTTIHTDANPLIPIYSAWAIAAYLFIPPSIFNGDTNDLIVPLTSQKCHINIFNTLQAQWHVGSSENTAIINGCMPLLDENPTSSLLFTNSGFPTDIIPPPIALPPSEENNYSRSTDSIGIISPASAQQFNPGNNVIVNLFTSGSNISRIGLIVYGNSINPISIDTPQVVSSLQFQIPTTAVGVLHILALGGDSSNWLASDTVSIIVNSANIPDSIVANPQTINLPIGITHSVSVVGYFSGSPINLIGTSGLTVTFDTNVVHYIAPGIFQGIIAGVTDAVFHYGALTDTVHIDVYDDPDALIASFNYSSDQVCVNSPVQFTDASLGIPVSYEWTFQGGTPSFSTQTNPVVTYSSVGIYSVKLKTYFTNGVDSVTLDSLIQVNPLPNAGTITTSGTWLIIQSGFSYQWYFSSDSVNYNPVSSSDNDSLSVGGIGWYFVSVTDANGCSANSDTIHNLIIGEQNLFDANAINIYPNPTDGIFTVEINSTKHDNLSLKVFDVMGRIVYEQKDIKNKTKHEVDLRENAPGIYFVNVKTEKQSLVQKIILHKQ
ncbi:MAG TPA: T9SS type A sorting domain-containing protein [Bacteroidia bacterium]|nr:T9SS type A sorting domain-containing protein [Bacteroidia bacterium]